MAVAIVIVARILVVLAAGYVMGNLILVIQRYVRGNVLKYWSRGSVRSWPKNGY